MIAVTSTKTFIMMMTITASLAQKNWVCCLFPGWACAKHNISFCFEWYLTKVVVVQSLSCVGLFCDPMDYSQPGSADHGILQAGILERVAISFSRGTSRPRDWTQVSRLACRHFTLWATGKSQSSSFSSSVTSFRKPSSSDEGISLLHSPKACCRLPLSFTCAFIKVMCLFLPLDYQLLEGR